MRQPKIHLKRVSKCSEHRQPLYPVVKELIDTFPHEMTIKKIAAKQRKTVKFNNTAISRKSSVANSDIYGVQPMTSVGTQMLGVSLFPNQISVSNSAHSSGVGFNYGKFMGV